MTADTTIVGPATLDLWVESASPIVDLQATITEVRPGAGQEEYVTSGFLRSSNQVDLPLSSKLFTVPSYLASDATTLSNHHLHPGQGADRPDRPHLPGRHRAACRHLRARRRPAVVGVRHAWTTAARSASIGFGKVGRLVTGGQRGPRT